MNEKRFKDCVSLLISIIQNYNNHVRFKMSGNPCEIYVQFFKLKSLMEDEGYTFVTETASLFDNFVFTELKFGSNYVMFCEVLKDLGFCFVEECFVYRFKVSVLVNEKQSLGVTGTGRESGTKANILDYLDIRSRVSSVFGHGIIVVATEEDISC